MTYNFDAKTMQHETYKKVKRFTVAIEKIIRLTSLNRPYPL